jgi:hypothetical protein
MPAACSESRELIKLTHFVFSIFVPQADWLPHLPISLEPASSAIVNN